MDGRLQTGNAWKGLVAGILGGLIAAWTMGQFHVLVTKLPRMQSPEANMGEDSTVKLAAAISRRVFHHILTAEEKKVEGATWFPPSAITAYRAPELQVLPASLREPLRPGDDPGLP